MLLSAAFSTPQASSSSYHAQLFASPPQTPPRSTTNPSTILASSFALQALISDATQQDQYRNDNFGSTTISPPAQAPPTPLLTPPTLCASIPSIVSNPIKLRLRSRKNTSSSDDNGAGVRAKRIIKRRTAATTKLKSRNMDVSEVTTKARALSSSPPSFNNGQHDTQRTQPEKKEFALDAPPPPRTPLQSSFVPTSIPHGLSHSDFHSLSKDADGNHEAQQSHHHSFEDISSSREWTSADDRHLVELILEKMKLSRSDWQECARELGRDKEAVGRRWKSLVCAGEVGLKGARRRGVCSGSWR